STTPEGARAVIFSLTPARAGAGSRSKARASRRDHMATPASGCSVRSCGPVRVCELVGLRFPDDKPCPLSGVKRTLGEPAAMSTCDPKRIRPSLRLGRCRCCLGPIQVLYLQREPPCPICPFRRVDACRTAKE